MTWQDPTRPSVLASSDFAKRLKTTVCQSRVLAGKEHFTGRASQEKRGSSPTRRAASAPRDSPKGYVLLSQQQRAGKPCCFCGSFKSLICDPPAPQKGLWILNFNPGWFCLAGYELLYLQITSREPASL